MANQGQQPPLPLPPANMWLAHMPHVPHIPLHQQFNLQNIPAFIPVLPLQNQEAAAAAAAAPQNNENENPLAGGPYAAAFGQNIPIRALPDGAENSITMEEIEDGTLMVDFPTANGQGMESDFGRFYKLSTFLQFQQLPNGLKKHPLNGMVGIPAANIVLYTKGQPPPVFVNNQGPPPQVDPIFFAQAGGLLAPIVEAPKGAIGASMKRRQRRRSTKKRRRRSQSYRRSPR